MRVHYTKINVNNKLQELNVENIDTSLDLHIYIYIYICNTG